MKEATERNMAAMGSDTWSFSDRIEREKKALQKMLVGYLKDGKIVRERAEELAAEDE